MNRPARYRLPATFGGGIVVAAAEGDHILVDIDGEQVPIPLAVVTPIKPPAPLGGWVIVHDPDNDVPHVFYRNPNWEGELEDLWWHYNVSMYCSWDVICTHGDPMPLIPQSAARGVCSVCRKTHPIRNDGMVKHHGGSRKCMGSERPPLAGGES